MHWNSSRLDWTRQIKRLPDYAGLEIPAIRQSGNLAQSGQITFDYTEKNKLDREVVLTHHPEQKRTKFP